MKAGRPYMQAMTADRDCGARIETAEKTDITAA
jgi:hypothetical protein